VDELDRDARSKRRIAPGRRREEDEQRAEAFAAGGEGFVADGGDEPRMRCDRSRKPLFERVEILREALGLAERAQGPDLGQDASPTWRATMPPAKRRNRTAAKPLRSSSALSSSGGGNLRTLAGRYV
jgi:hypothetical protein